MIKRCEFCGRKLDNDGYCTNKKCPESIRAEIVKKVEEESKTDEGR